MDKNAIKKYAVWARTELIERVTQKALQYGISEKNIIDANADSINGKLLTEVEKKQRKALIGKINDKGFEQVLEEVAYTWFNRFSALRFMEVNGYLPSHVRVFTDEDNNFKPQILTEAIHLEIDGLDMEKVYTLKEENKNEELYKYLLIIQCNALNKILPGMFQPISDYTELLLPDNLLRDGSVIQQMIEIIPEEDWKDAVQIIGWLYQYYNTEPKAKVFSRPSTQKIAKEDVPAATQLFTPDWIVHYMVENSLGRLWYQGHPDETLKSNWKYYLDEVKQEAEVQVQLNKIREEYKGIKPEDIKCIDPCMGSGHILVYMFDVLMQIYKSYGYNAHEAATSILKNNLYGLDIDDRAAQLAYFAVMMKARQYDRRFFVRDIQPHIYAIIESNNISADSIDYFVKGNPEIKAAINTLVIEMYDAKEYGSILNITNVDFDSLYARFDELKDEVSLFKQQVVKQLLPLVKVAQAMSQKYDVVVTNPPYMAVSNATTKVQEYIKSNFYDSKSDLFAVFIEQCNKMLKYNRYQAMITQHSWMFLSSYETLRKKLLTSTIVNMVHLGARGFEEIGGEVVQTTAFVLQSLKNLDYLGVYCRLTEPTTQCGKEKMFLKSENRYMSAQRNYIKVPGSPIAYWWNNNIYNCFKHKQFIPGNPMKGIQTGKGEKYLRFWFEVSLLKTGFNVLNHDDMICSGLKWFPLTSGGQSRKWYGNYEMVVNLENNGWDIRSTGLKNFRLKDPLYYFLEGLTWTEVTTKPFTCRYLPPHILFGNGGPVTFQLGNKLNYTMGLLNSVVSKEMFSVLAPTMNYGPDQVRNIPFKYIDNDICSKLVEKNINICKIDWDSFETSWEFKEHPLVELKQRGSMNRWNDTIELAYRNWEISTNERFTQLKSNEEELNRIFIDIYGLHDELKPEVEDKDITVCKADMTREIKSLISYAVGCMFGRYSLDVEGLVYAGGYWDNSKYTSYPSDEDNIIPICDDEYFEEDIVGRFVKFVEKVYGKETLEENLKFIADTLGGKGSPKDIIRNYFLNYFFADHCKIYQKRPIYWLFDSGKKNGFKCLIYMHRYQPDTIARIRTDYLHEQQSRYRTAITDLEQRINSASNSERVKLNKQLSKLKDQELEVRIYEEQIHHLADQMISIDLDDGVKINYEKFKDVLAKIK